MAIAMATSLLFIAPANAQGHRTSSNSVNNTSSAVSNKSSDNKTSNKPSGSFNASQGTISNNNSNGSSHRSTSVTNNNSNTRPSNGGNNNSGSNGSATRPSNPGNNNGGSNGSATRPSNPGNNNGGNGSATRPSNPGNNNGGNGSATRPSNPGNNNGSIARPGGSGTAGTRPNHGSTNSPGYGNGSSRPTNGSPVYSGGYRPNYKGPGSVSHPSTHSAPPRPMRPRRDAAYFFTRPVRPASYRPVTSLYFNSFLGVNIGMSMNNSLDYLLANRYYIDGYTSNTIYLRYVTELGFRWPDANLYYDYGRLAAAEFIFSTAYNDLSRYNNVFSVLLNRYGNPVRINSNNGYNATWYGPQGFITLDYHPAYSNNNYLRYFTTLTYGM